MLGFRSGGGEKQVGSSSRIQPAYRKLNLIRVADRWRPNCFRKLPKVGSRQLVHYPQNTEGSALFQAHFAACFHVLPRRRSLVYEHDWHRSSKYHPGPPSSGCGSDTSYMAFAPVVVYLARTLQIRLGRHCKIGLCSCIEACCLPNPPRGITLSTTRQCMPITVYSSRTATSFDK